MLIALFLAVFGVNGPFYVAPRRATGSRGSVRYYAHRVTLRYDWLADDQLDAGVHDRERKGRPAFVLVDEWEDKESKTKPGLANRLGRLDWASIARLTNLPEVRLYTFR